VKFDATVSLNLRWHISETKGRKTFQKSTLRKIFERNVMLEMGCWKKIHVGGNVRYTRHKLLEQ
jgi:hypothetical protein